MSHHTPEHSGAGDTLSGGERILKDSGGKPREQSSPPTQLTDAEIDMKFIKRDTQLREIAEKWANEMPGMNKEFRQQLLSIILRATQESWEIGYGFGCDADNSQYKYGYKKGLADGDDTHALQ